MWWLQWGTKWDWELVYPTFWQIKPCAVQQGNSSVCEPARKGVQTGLGDGVNAKRPLSCMEVEPMTSSWQDYLKPCSNLYCTHNTFLQHDRENNEKACFLVSVGFTAVWMISDWSYRLGAVHESYQDVVTA